MLKNTKLLLIIGLLFATSLGFTLEGKSAGETVTAHNVHADIVPNVGPSGTTYNFTATCAATANPAVGITATLISCFIRRESSLIGASYASWPTWIVNTQATASSFVADGDCVRFRFESNASAYWNNGGYDVDVPDIPNSVKLDGDGNLCF